MRIESVLCALILLLAGACAKTGSDSDAHESSATVKSDLTSEAAAWADSVCASLDIESKAAQLFLPAVYSRADASAIDKLRRYAESGIGGVLLLKGDTTSVMAVVDTLRSLSDIMPFIAIDAEWGLAMRLSDTPQFPYNNAIDPEADEQLMYDYGREVAREARALGINMVLGPVVDVISPGGVMKFRSFGDDPQRVADMAVAYARGLEDGDVISVAKHFPGHGSVSADSHQRKGIIHRSLNQMDSIDLYPFKKWVDQKLTGIMVGHLAVPSIDSQLLPAAVSPTVIQDLLRNELGFSGLVITDAINMKGAEGFTGVDAVLAGADIIIAPGDTFSQIEEVIGAVKSGRLPETTLNDHVRRILFYKYLSGLNVSAPLVHNAEPAPVSPDSISRSLQKRR